MYKRHARILFLEAAPAIRARMAEAAGSRLGTGWLEARAASLAVREGAGSVDAQCAPLTEALLAWADLVVTLDAGSERHCPPLPPGTRRKHWTLVGTKAQAAGEIEAQVRSMVAGLRMLARSDAAGDPGNHDAED
ncbi:MAG TPA: hypothetical protein VKA50_11045 [Gammaproteobacteria bacterium]|nr:hypothetical protein [Gammaproteobacteria bacterium]